MGKVKKGTKNIGLLWAHSTSMKICKIKIALASKIKFMTKEK